MFRALQRRIDRIEECCPGGAATARRGGTAELIMEDEDGNFSVEFEDGHWDIDRRRAAQESPSSEDRACASTTR